MADEAARKKYDNALRLIEQAQNLLGEACGELSSLIGAFGQWKAVGDHCDKTKQLWRNVAYSFARDEVRLDSSLYDMEQES